MILDSGLLFWGHPVQRQFVSGTATALAELRSRKLMC